MGVTVEVAARALVRAFARRVRAEGRVVWPALPGLFSVNSCLGQGCFSWMYLLKIVEVDSECLAALEVVEE